MNTKIINVSDAVEGQKILGFLEENEIKYVLKKYGTSAFPEVFEGTYGWGQIEIDREDYLRYKNDFDEICNVKDTPNVQVEKSKSKYKLIIAGLLFYSLVVSFYCLKYWRLNERYSDVKNFVHAWVSNNESLQTNLKSTKNIWSFSTDKNFDGNFEKFIAYSKIGLKTSESFDKNEDGIFEVTHYFNNKGELSGKHYDKNEDGRIDYIEYLDENNRVIKFKDNNNDGNFELEINGDVIHIIQNK